MHLMDGLFWGPSFGGTDHPEQLSQKEGDGYLVLEGRFTSFIPYQSRQSRAAKKSETKNSVQVSPVGDRSPIPLPIPACLAGFSLAGSCSQSWELTSDPPRWGVSSLDSTLTTMEHS